MTPQQKADELVKKYHDTCNCTIAGTSTIFRQIAIQCAIICVEEMIKVSLPACEYGEDIDFQWGTEFLQSVLNELKSRLP